MKFRGNNMVKKIFAVIIIIVTLFGYVPSIVQAVETIAVKENENEYVTFKVSNPENVTSEVATTFQYDMIFSGVQTGFNNIEIYVTDVPEGGKPNLEITSNSTMATDVINSGSSTIITYDNIKTGTNMKEIVYINFGKDPYYQKYDKSLKFIAQGNYINPITKVVENFYYEEIVTVTVYPNNYSSVFETHLSADLDSWVGEETVIRDNEDKLIGEYLKEGTATYNVDFYSMRYTNEATINITIDQADSIIKGTGMLIDFAEFIEDGYKVININGDEETDTNGAIYKLEDEEGNYKLTRLKDEGKITFTLYKKAESEDVQNAFSEYEWWERVSIAYLVPHRFNFNITYYTGLNEDNITLFNTYENRQSLKKPISIEIEAKGWNYNVQSDMEGEKVDITKTEVTKNLNALIPNSLGILECFPGQKPGGEYDRLIPKYDVHTYTEDFLNIYSGILFTETFAPEYRGLYGIFENNEESTGTLNLNNYKIMYYDENGQLTSMDLDGSCLKIVNLEGCVSRSLNDKAKVSVKYGENEAGEINKEQLKLTSFYGVNNNLYMEYNDWQNVGGNGYTSFCITYELNFDALRAKGMTEENLKNIERITANFNCDFDLVTASSDYIIAKFIYYDYTYLSNMDVELDEDYKLSFSDLNENVTQKFTIKMCENKENWSKYTYALNVNPTFYIEVDKEDFRYTGVDVEITYTDEGNTDDVNFMKVAKKPYYKKINDKVYIVIECEGTYNSKKHDPIQLNVAIKRKLSNIDAKVDKSLNVYMLTDNELYVSNIETYNSVGLTKKDETPVTVGFDTEKYSIGNRGAILSSTYVSIKDAYYTSNLSNDIDDTVEKNKPLVVPEGITATFIGVLENRLNKVDNVKMLFRLPVENNTYILPDEGTTNYSKLIEDDFTLTEEYVEEYSKIDGISANSPVTQISLEDLSNIKVLVNKNEISSENYTIYYTNEFNTGFEITEDYIEYVEGESDVTNAKSILVKLNEDYVLESGAKLTVQYQMTMPEGNDEYGMVGSVYGVTYTHAVTGNVIELDTEPAYVIKGKLSELQIQKVFQGLDVGVAPDGVSLKGIEFNVKDEYGIEYIKDYYDNDNDGDTQENLVITTNENGIATISKIDEGVYTLEENSDFAKFAKYDKTNFIVEVESGTVTKVNAENPLKTATIEIQKTFEDTNEIIGNATFTLERIEGDKVNYRTTVTTDDEGKASVVGVPYGKYRIIETRGVIGYGTTEQEIVVDTEVEQVTFENPIGKGTIRINKTVPEGETVEGLKFQITGKGLVSYVNTQGETINNNTDLLITVGEDYSAIPNINVTISEDKLSTTIEVTNLNLGIFTIEEVEIPNVEGKEIPRFVAVKVGKTLTKDGEIAEVDIKNKKKVGYVQIQKRAFVQAGDELQEIGDLSEFKVQITGESYYGTPVDKVISLDVDGYAITALEIGTYTLKEIPVDGYDIYYKNEEGNLVNNENGIEIEVKFNEAGQNSARTNVEIENILTGKGYVRVEKTLEGVENPQEVLDAGIEFKVVGKNAAGGRVEELIKIDKIDLEKNVAYGTSAGILVGGEYQLEEVETTIPNYYEGMEPKPIQITTSYTETNPLIISVENKRVKGNLEIVTETDPEGGTLAGIEYKVTQVEINKDGTYTKIDGTEIELQGSNGLTNQSFVEVEEINAGNYLVEQTKVPSGYEKDVPQIVEVPNYGIGYAIFVIKQPKELEQTELIINKEILNEAGEKATAEDFEEAELIENESFEVKLTNVDTKQVYYTFISGAQKGTIVGLEPGIYEIEEQYKPKYKTEGYYEIVEGIAPIEITATESGKYIIEIQEQETKEISIRNKINTSFPFGGQDLKDNYSQIDVEQQEIERVTKAVVYIVDEEGNALPGSKFKIIDSKGNTVILGTIGTEFTTVNKKLVINGLPEGNYTLVNTSVPDGYLQPADKEITVYNDAVRVARIEIQKNIPRGSLTLSTTYVTADNEIKYVPRSKYKVVNKETGELVKFTRTATGDYIKSNVEDATTVINLKSSTVELDGLEVGTYEIGLVDVTSGYGMKTDLPETVGIVQNEIANVNVNVVKKKIVQVETSRQSTLYLDESGQLWILGGNDSGLYANGMVTTSLYNEIPTLIKFPDNTFITKFAVGEYCAVAIDSNGKVWTWGSRVSGNGSVETVTEEPICLSDIEGNLLNVAFNNNTKMQDVEVNGNVYLLDNNGKIWSWGEQNSSGQLGNATYQQSLIPVCVSDIEGTDLYDAYNNGIKITKLASENGTYNYLSGAIDSLGRIWLSGYMYNVVSTNVFKCISSSDLDFASAYMVDLTTAPTADGYAAVDRDGNVWISGNKIPKETFNGNKIVQVKFGYEVMYFIDENGKVWGNGSGYVGSLGIGTTDSSSTPICISEYSELQNYKVIDIATVDGTSGVVCLDSENNIYGWGINLNYGQMGKTNDMRILLPKKIEIDYTEHMKYNLKYTALATARDSTVALDENGDLWGIGERRVCGLGYGSNPSGIAGSSYTTEFTQITGFADEKIIKVCSLGSGYLVLTENGKVYIFGDNFRYGENGTTKSYCEYTPKNITETFDLEEDVKIVNISSGYYGQSCLAIDSIGRVWTWGYNGYGALGNGTTDYNKNTTPICISDEPTEPLYNVKIKEIGGLNSIYAIDEQGRIWYWGGYHYYTGVSYAIAQKYMNTSGCITSPICITNIEEGVLGFAYSKGTKFTKLSGSSSNMAVLDNNGKVWAITGSNEAYCINDIQGHTICEQSKKYENYAFEKIIVLRKTSEILATDNQGIIWIIDKSGATKIQDIYNVPTDIKDIVFIEDTYGQYLIDGYGQIWKWGDALECLANTIQNSLYGKKFKNIIENGIVETDNGEIYIVDAQSSTFLMYSETYIKENFSKELVYVNRDINYSDYSDRQIIAIDEDGKLWAWENQAKRNDSRIPDSIIPICISDMPEYEELYNEHKKDSNFKLETIIDTTRLVDNYGRIWYWGYTDEITCISEKEGTELNKAYEQGAKIVDHTIDGDYYYFTDSNGNIWMYGYHNESGQLGNGTFEEISIEDPYCISKAINTKIKKILQYTFGSGSDTKIFTIILDTEGNVWYCGGHEGQYNGYECSTNNATLKKLTNENSEKVLNIVLDNNDGLRLIVENGYYSITILGDIKNNEYYDDLSLLYRKTETAYTIQEWLNIVTYYGNYCFIDTEGKVWTAGGRGLLGYSGTSNYSPITCISDDEAETLYGINIIDILAYVKNRRNSC